MQPSDEQSSISGNRAIAVGPQGASINPDFHSPIALPPAVGAIVGHREFLTKRDGIDGFNAY